MFTKRTDLAVESHELYRQSQGIQEVPGVFVDTEKFKKINVTRVHVKNEEGQKAIGKPPGSYITLEIPELIRLFDT